MEGNEYIFRQPFPNSIIDQLIISAFENEHHRKSKGKRPLVVDEVIEVQDMPQNSYYWFSGVESAIISTTCSIVHFSFPWRSLFFNPRHQFLCDNHWTLFIVFARTTSTNQSDFNWFNECFGQIAFFIILIAFFLFYDFIFFLCILLRGSFLSTLMFYVSFRYPFWLMTKRGRK